MTFTHSIPRRDSAPLLLSRMGRPRRQICVSVCPLHGRERRIRSSEVRLVNSFVSAAAFFAKLIVVALAFAPIASRRASAAEKPNEDASVVRLVKHDGGYQLLRDGQPYFIRGAGGKDHLEALAAAGGNSIRTWGGEEVSFEFGLLGPDKKFADSGHGKLDKVRLTAQWQPFQIDLSGQDLTRIKTGFAWVVAPAGNAVTFYLDDIRYE